MNGQPPLWRRHTTTESKREKARWERKNWHRRLYSDGGSGQATVFPTVVVVAFSGDTQQRQHRSCFPATEICFRLGFIPSFGQDLVGFVSGTVGSVACSVAIDTRSFACMVSSYLGYPFRSFGFSTFTRALSSRNRKRNRT
ncbi:hypothetical protein Hanom_Chr00s145107g01820091 [Helianthus anomalus]